MPNSNLGRGTPVPPVSLRASNGDNITLSHLKGMTVVDQPSHNASDVVALLMRRVSK